MSGSESVRKNISLKLSQKSKTKRPHSHTSDVSDDVLIGEISTRIDRENLEPLHHDQKLNWDYRGRCDLSGEKLQDPLIHICDECDLPIKQYGRMIPCKHIFCYTCAQRRDSKCSRCDDKVSRIEKCSLGSVYLCTFGGSKHGRGGCRRTYLSQRDLDAHMNHRHKRAKSSHNQLPQTNVSKPEPRPAAVTEARRAPLISTPPQSTFPDKGLSDLATLVATQPPPSAQPAVVSSSLFPQPAASHSTSNLITLTDNAARPTLPPPAVALLPPPQAVPVAFSVPPPTVPFQQRFPAANPAVFQQTPPPTQFTQPPPGHQAALTQPGLTQQPPPGHRPGLPQQPPPQLTQPPPLTQQPPPGHPPPARHQPPTQPGYYPH